MQNRDRIETHPDNSVSRVGLGEYQIHTQIDIDAPASVVWETLTDFDNYDWSTSFRGLDGGIEPGAIVNATFHMAGRDQTVEHRLKDVEPGVQWAWSDPIRMGMTDDHLYRVEPIDATSSRFIQRDRPRGGAAIVAGRFIARSFRKMYEEFNAELKAEAERRYQAS